MSNWISAEDAIEHARDMVSNIIVKFNRNGETIKTMIEVQGIEKMYALVATLKSLESQSKISNFEVINLTNLPLIQSEDFLNRIQNLSPQKKLTTVKKRVILKKTPIAKKPKKK